MFRFLLCFVLIFVAWVWSLWLHHLQTHLVMLGILGCCNKIWRNVQILWFRQTPILGLPFQLFRFSVFEYFYSHVVSQFNIVNICVKTSSYGTWYWDFCLSVLLRCGCCFLLRCGCGFLLFCSLQTCFQVCYVIVHDSIIHDNVIVGRSRPPERG